MQNQYLILQRFPIPRNNLSHHHFHLQNFAHHTTENHFYFKTRNYTNMQVIMCLHKYTYISIHTCTYKLYIPHIESYFFTHLPQSSRYHKTLGRRAYLIAYLLLQTSSSSPISARVSPPLNLINCAANMRCRNLSRLRDISRCNNFGS